MSPLSPAFTGPPRAEIDAAVDGAVRRIRDRMAPFGGAFADLGTALEESSGGGKRFRPTLVVATAESLGAGSSPARWPVAAAFELLHAAFLVHDDLIDHDTVRRGVPNIAGRMRRIAEDRGAGADAAAELADAAALLAGDLLLHEAQRLVATAPCDPAMRERLLDLLDEAVLVSAAGELADVAHAVLDEEPAAAAILTATHDKTAVYSFAAPLRAGAVLAGADLETEDVLARAGSRLGLAFQLVDDLIGAFGTSEQAGRETGVDLRAAKKTALVAFARATDRWPEVSRALAAAPTGPIAVRRAQLALDGSGARRELEDVVRGALDDARTIAREGALPVATVELVDRLADAVEARIP